MDYVWIFCLLASSEY